MYVKLHKDQHILFTLVLILISSHDDCFYVYITHDGQALELLENPRPRESETESGQLSCGGLGLALTCVCNAYMHVIQQTKCLRYCGPRGSYRQGRGLGLGSQLMQSTVLSLSLGLLSLGFNHTGFSIQVYKISALMFLYKISTSVVSG